jgi:uncharacterized protein
LESDLDQLIATGMSTAWVTEHLVGVAACAETCPYFTFCGGAHPANKYFETGRFDITETIYCRNSKIRLLEGAFDASNATR